ncbi:unnamed protein product [Linum trigynum]|uniref:Uncharacterized protein n=1 Tax=Linum trigynum TaxID=586398 RepID=A0AAV2E4W4_9ROSI
MQGTIVAVAVDRQYHRRWLVAEDGGGWGAISTTTTTSRRRIGRANDDDGPRLFGPNLLAFACPGQDVLDPRDRPPPFPLSTVTPAGPARPPS